MYSIYQYVFQHLKTGLHLFGQALTDVKNTLIACNETVIVKDLEKFIEDLISCTEGIVTILNDSLAAVCCFFVFFLFFFKAPGIKMYYDTGHVFPLGGLIC